MQEHILGLLRELQPSHDFEASADFVEDGLLDSFDIVTLVSDLENQFGVIISALDILPENFGTIEAIGALVNRSEKRS